MDTDARVHSVAHSIEQTIDGKMTMKGEDNRKDGKGKWLNKG